MQQQNRLQGERARERVHNATVNMLSETECYTNTFLLPHL